MKLHTNLTEREVYAALHRAQDKGLITQDVHFTVFTPGRSMTHPHGYEIQLGTHDPYSLPAGYTDQNGHRLHVRRARNASHGDARRAATWHEWGWFIAEVFAADPGSRWGADPARSARPEYAGGYAGPEDFHRKTDGQFQPHLEHWTPPILQRGGNLVITVPRLQHATADDLEAELTGANQLPPVTASEARAKARRIHGH